MFSQPGPGISSSSDLGGASGDLAARQGPFAHLAVPPVVSIDGGAGTGKSTVATLLAKALGGVPVIDSGLWFRALGLTITQLGISPDNEKAVCKVLDRLAFDPGIDAQGRHTMKVFYRHRGEVSIYSFGAEELASTCAGDIASTIGPYRLVRNFLKAKQRELAFQGAVTAGRAQGAEVFNDHFQQRTSQEVVRVLLHAAPEVRAERRFAQLTQHGSRDPSLSFDNILADIQERDRRDTRREHGGLLTKEQASKAGYVVINTGPSSSGAHAPTAAEVVDSIIAELRKRGLISPNFS